MKFLKLYLKNYIGIYNGMGLREITIDFSQCTHRIVMLRGDNGSGKSTIMRSLSIFPDDNDQFIKGKPAQKIIVIGDGNISYNIVCDHGIKHNGERETKKVYIEKFDGINSTQLNPNGNVSSYKDVLYDEFGLDPNFESLSQLSTDDRGIADKTPADRKRFVNSILTNLEVYNDIYKTLTKRSTSYKNLINSVTAKLTSIGNINTVMSNISGIESKINEIQNSKDIAIESLANAKAKMELIDPDGSIQTTMDRIREENESYTNTINSLSNTITKLRLSIGLNVTDNTKKIIENTKSAIETTNIDNQINRGKIESLLKEKESEVLEVQSKIAKLQSLDQDWMYEKICNEIDSNEQELKGITQQLSVTGIIDILSFSKDSYIAALKSIESILSQLDIILADNHKSIIDMVIEEYINSGIIPSIENTSNLSCKLESLKMSISEKQSLLTRAEIDIDRIKILDSRPSNCKIDDCPFIKEALIISKNNPQVIKERCLIEINNIEIEISKLQEQISISIEKNTCIKQLSDLLRYIEISTTMVKKLPCGYMFSNKQDLIKALFYNNYQSYLNSIYSYIDLANLFDRYKVLTDSLNKLYSEKEVYESKQDIIIEFQADIDRINQKLSDIEKQIIPMQTQLANNDKYLIRLNDYLSNLQVLNQTEEELDKYTELINNNMELYKSNIEKIKQLESARVTANSQVELIDRYNRELSPLMHDRDKLSHQIRLIDDYNNELNKLNGEYKLIETIRKYSSPTTGIQLVFMQMYMGKVIEFANDLLSIFFEGQFQIMPFIINESEFRIPCAGEGILNDDISSMSSAQIAMISMILSFSFLYNSSTKYNSSYNGSSRKSVYFFSRRRGNSKYAF